MNWILLLALILPSLAIVVSITKPGYLRSCIVGLKGASFAALLIPWVVLGLLGIWQAAHFYTNAGGKAIDTASMIFNIAFASIGAGMVFARFRLLRATKKDGEG